MRIVVMFWLGLTAACGAEADDDNFPPPAAGEGIQLSYSAVAEPGSELWKCNVTDLASTEWLAVNRVESVQNDSVHHMDLMAVALAAPDLQPGEYDCADVYAQYPRLMDDGILIYASQQAEQHIQLPPGTAAELLPRLRVMHEIHYVNSTEETVTAFSKINAYKYPPEQVERTIWGGAVRDLDISVPAGASGHVEWTRCTMNADVDVLFMSSHTHKLAERTVIRSFNGTATGDVMYTNTDWHAPPLQDFTAAPIHVPQGAGFEFECHYKNAGTTDVHWGFTADDEMCQIALVYTPGETTRKCEVVASGVR
ncbi:MAG TPA: hypothetical protein VIV11_01655 [Kofleriaceae bacterium]